MCATVAKCTSLDSERIDNGHAHFFRTNWLCPQQQQKRFKTVAPRPMLRRFCKNGSCLLLTISLRVFWAENVVCGWSFPLVFSLFDVLQVQVAPAQGVPKIELFSSLSELIAYPALFFCPAHAPPWPSVLGSAELLHNVIICQEPPH